MIGVAALLGTELRRFFSRRVTRGAFAFGIALSTLVLVILTVRSDVRTVAEPGQQVVCPGQTGVPPTVGSSNGQLPNSCQIHEATVLVSRDHRLKIHDNLSGTVTGTGVSMIFVAFVIGASFIGAEFTVGSLGLQLIFEPRRGRVVAVKAIAVGIGLALLSIALLLYLAFLQWAGSSLRGVVANLDTTWFAARSGDIVRVAAAVGLAGIAAYAMTVVTRRTVAAVATLLVVGWVSTIIQHLSDWRWLTKYNPATVFISMAVDPTRSNNGGPNAITIRTAMLSSCAWAVALTVVAAVIFARREVR